MRTLKTLTVTVVLAALAACALAGAPADLADLVPADAKAFVETADAAGLRGMLLESKFWDALGQTEAIRLWRASERYAQMQQRVEQFLANLKMSRDDALKTYLGGRSAVVLVASGETKPCGVILIEVDDQTAERFMRASGAERVGKYRGVDIWQVRKDDRVDRMAYTAGVLMVSGSRANELEQVIDSAARSMPALGSQTRFGTVAEGLPEGWRARAYASAQVGPHQGTGAVAMYPKSKGRVHFEWRLIGQPGEFDINRPAVLTGPKALPDSAVAAIATAFHPQVIWAKVKAKLEGEPDGAEKLRKADMFVRGWFAGQSMEAITAAFGPEAAGAILKGEGGGAPGLVGMVHLTAGGQPVAQAFKNGLAAKAMILGALGQNREDAPRISVREETHANVSLVVIEAPQILEKVLGDWAKDIGLTVAVTNDWLIVGTTPAGVKQAISAAAGSGASLATALKEAGEKVPTEATTRWGVVQPASGADIILAWAEKLAGKQSVEQIKKVTNLAELMKLVKRVLWQRTDEADIVRGSADIQAID